LADIDRIKYNSHSAGYPRLAISNAKYKYVFQIKYTETILSNSTRKFLRFEITKMLIAVLRNKLIVLFIINFGTLSFQIEDRDQTDRANISSLTVPLTLDTDI